MSEQNKVIVCRYWEAANHHEANGMREVLATDYVHHDPSLPFSININITVAVNTLVTEAVSNFVSRVLGM